MLIFSNREIQGRADTAPFRQRFPAAFAQRALATLESLSQAPTACWKVSQVDSDVDDADSISTLLPLFRDSRPMLLYCMVTTTRLRRASSAVTGCSRCTAWKSSGFPGLPTDTDRAPATCRTS